MNVNQLKHIIDSQLASIPRFGELEVKILVREKGNGIGARPHVSVYGACFGFDMEDGLLIMSKEPIQKIKQ